MENCQIWNITGDKTVYIKMYSVYTLGKAPFSDRETKFTFRKRISFLTLVVGKS